jgi:CBS domain containing-hemolysin-like protein
LEAGTYIPLFLLVILLLACSAFFAGSESAYFSLRHTVIQRLRNGARKERRVAELLSRPRTLLVTILLGNLFVNVASTSIVTAIIIKMVGENSVGISTLVMTVVILIVGEVVPKSVALRSPVRLSTAASPVYRVLIYIFGPIQRFLVRIADSSVSLISRLWGEPRAGYGTRELVHAVREGYRKGVFGEFEAEMLTNFFRFAETTVEEVQIPRVDVFSVDVETPVKEAAAIVKQKGFSRVPVYRETSDSIVGILLAKDLLRHYGGDGKSLEGMLREPWFIPENKKIRYLLNNFIESRRHLAMVVDEHGSYSGIVTLEDILEKVFGEIRDRREQDVKMYHILDPGKVVVVDGTFRLEGFEQIMDTSLDIEDVETVAGYLVEKIGRIPGEGEAFNLGDFRYLVISAGRKKVDKIKIERIENGEGGE